MFSYASGGKRPREHTTRSPTIAHTYTHEGARTHTHNTGKRGICYCKKTHAERHIPPVSFHRLPRPLPASDNRRSADGGQIACDNDKWGRGRRGETKHPAGETQQLAGGATSSGQREKTGGFWRLPGAKETVMTTTRFQNAAKREGDQRGGGGETEIGRECAGPKRG